VHGSFSREREPVLEIEAGDRVRYRTLDARWGLEPFQAGRGQMRKAFEPQDAEKDRGHALCGPVFIKGARPGMTLEVKIEKVAPGAYGWTFAGGGRGSQNAEVFGTGDGERCLLRWKLNHERGKAYTQDGIVVSMKPFMGVLGMPPDEPGFHPTQPPRACGGNIDCKELVEGSRLYLPTSVPGALFSVGDGHAAQGDGEICTQAIECPMERVDLSFELHDRRIETPCAQTPAGFITFGFDEDLNRASLIAARAMIDHMSSEYSIDRKQALALLSVVVDLRVTQICNGVRGVHAVLPHGAIEMPGRG